MLVQLRPCLMHDYGCRLKAKTHLFCPNHWVQIHLDDRDALDNPMHKRCVTWGVDAATGQLAYCPDKEKHRAIALQVVEALAKKEEAERDRESERLIITEMMEGQPVTGVETPCPSCGVVNIKSATANSCGACGESLIPSGPTEGGLRPMRCAGCDEAGEGPDRPWCGHCGGCRECGHMSNVHTPPITEKCPTCGRAPTAPIPPGYVDPKTIPGLLEPDPEADPYRESGCTNCDLPYHRPQIYCDGCGCCVMCGHPQGYPVPEYAARCGQCGRGK